MDVDADGNIAFKACLDCLSCANGTNLAVSHYYGLFQNNFLAPPPTKIFLIRPCIYGHFVHSSRTVLSNTVDKTVQIRQK